MVAGIAPTGRSDAATQVTPDAFEAVVRADRDGVVQVRYGTSVRPIAVKAGSSPAAGLSAFSSLCGGLAAAFTAA